MLGLPELLTVAHSLLRANIRSRLLIASLCEVGKLCSLYQTCPPTDLSKKSGQIGSGPLQRSPIG